MARESEFIDKLSDFTKSLESLVEILKEQEKNSPTEVLNKMLDNFDGNVLSTIAEDLTIVKKTTLEINKNVEKTLEVVKSLKKEKEVGMFGEIEDGKNKQKIIDGVKTVVLISAGVLAVGMAFKLIGNVDILSIIGIGLGIVFVASAFAKVASIKDGDGKNISWKQAMTTSQILLIMSGAMVASGLILRLMPTLNIMQMASIVGVGLGVGLASYFLLSAIGKLELKQLKIAPLIPLVVPLVALGLVGAGWVLKKMPKLSSEQIFSAIGVSIALVPISIAFGYMVKGFKDISMSDLLEFSANMPPIMIGMSLGIVESSWILKLVANIDFMAVLKAGIGVGIATLAMVPTIYLLNKAGLLKTDAIASMGIALAIIPIMAGIVVLSSFILQNVVDIPLKNVLKTGIGIGLASLAMTPTIIVLQKMGLLKPSAIPELLVAAAVIPLIAAALTVSSWILSLGTYGNYPNLGWALGVGLSVVAFGSTMAVFALLSKGGIGLDELVEGGFSVLIVASTIMLSSYILGLGAYDTYPTLEWSLGVGLSMISFGTAMVVLGFLVEFMLLGALAVLLVAGTIVATSYILATGKYDKYPSLDWAEGVGLSLIGFGLPMIVLGLALPLLFMGTYAIEMVVDTIVKTSLALASGKYDKFPSLDWAQGITTSLIGFGLPMMILGLALPLIVAGALSVMAIVETLSLVDEILSDGNFTKYPSDDWANGVSKSVQMFSAMVNSIDVDLGNLLSLWAITKAMDNFSEKMFDIQTNYGEIFNNGGVAQNIAKSIQALVTAMPKQSDVDPIYSLITALNALANVEWDNLLNIAPMSSMIGQLASQIDLINESKVESLAKLGAGLHIISLVDETRLKSTLDAIQSKSNALSQIMDEHSVISGVFDRAKNQISGKENNQPTTVKKPGQQEEISSFEEQMLNYIKNIDTNIGKMANVTKEEREEAIKGKDVEDDGGWFSGWF